MVASRAARERKAAAEAGPLGQVKIDLDADGSFVYKISCTACTTRAGAKGDRPWSAYRIGADNGFMAAMDRWTFHLHEQHPESDAPCLAYLPAAQQRLHERRLQQEAQQGT
ncbi:hypothetical protein BH09ACT12_BH09ACT12_06850 [soil metagenome]